MDIFSLVGKVTVNYGDAVKGIDEVSSRAGNLATTLGKNMQSAGQKITSVGKSLAPVSVAAGGVATAAIKMSMDFDSSMSKVAAISGATGKNFQALRDKALEMGGKTKFSVTEAAEAMTYMAMAGWETSDMLSGIEGIMNLAAAAGEDLATTSDIVTDALTAFGLSAVDSGHFADILAAAATSANTDVSMMGETFKYAAPVMGALGYSAEDTSLAIGLMANSSIKASTAGTTLRGAFSRLVDPTDSMVEAMLAYGLATQETGVDQEKLEKAQYKVSAATLNVQKAQVSYNQAVAKYGQQSPQAQKALIGVQQASLKLEQAQSDLDKVQNTLVGTGEVTNLILNDEEGNARSLRGVITFLRKELRGLDEQQQSAAVSAIFGTEAMTGMLAIINASDEDFDKLANAIDNCDGSAQEIAGIMQDNLAGQLTDLGSKLQVLGVSIMDLFTPALRGIVEQIQGFVSWLNGLNDSSKRVIATIVLAVTALSPVLIVIGKVVSAIGTIITVVSKISRVVSGVIHVVSGAASFISGTVIPAIGAIVSTVGIVPIAIAAAVAAVIAVFVLLWNKCEGFREFWINLWEGIKSVVSTAIEGIKGFFSGILDFITNNWQGLLLLLANPFLGAFKLLYDNCEGFRTFIHGFLEGVKNIVSTVMGAIASIFATIWNGITNFVVNVWEGIVQVGKTIFEGLAAFFTACWEGIKAVAVTIWTAISAFFGTIWEGIKTIVTTVVTAIQTFLATAWNTIKTVITTVLNAIKTVFSTVWGAIKTVVTTVMEAVKSFITTAWNAIKSIISNVLNGIKNVITTAWNAIKTTISNVLNGIKSVISSIWNSIKSIVTSVLNGIKNVITTVWNGIKTTISNLMNSIVSVFGTAWNGIKSTIGDVINGIKTAISNGLNGAKNVVVNVLSAIRDTFWNIFEGAANIVQNAIERIKNLFNFDWSLPQIKLPHFSINGQFSLNPPQIPSIGVEWYKKAMDGGMIMNQPTVFGYDPKANQLLAGGEAGSETVVGTKSLMQMIQSAVSSENDELIAVLHLILEAIYTLDEGLGEKFYRALLNTRFQINEREFARLVKAV